MIDAGLLSRLVRENIETLCRNFAPRGKRDGNEWKIADNAGGEGESLGIQLRGEKAGLWHDRATGAGGDFPKFLMENRDINYPEAARLIGSFLGVNVELAGGPNGEAPPKAKAPQAAAVPPPPPFTQWKDCVSAVTPEPAAKLCAWRGLSAEYVEWLQANKLIGRYNDCWAFPVTVKGVVVGIHFRVPPRTQGGKVQWPYQPSGLGVHPFVIGKMAQAKTVHAFESQWDMFALDDKLQLHQDGAAALAATRGARNAKLLSCIPKSALEVMLWPQNDEPGQKWLADAIETLGERTIKIARTPENYDDANDWILKGATDSELSKALLAARPPDPVRTEADADEKPQDVLRPSYGVYHHASYVGEKLLRVGTYYHGIETRKGKTFTTDDWICAPLEVLAISSNREDGEYGRLVEFTSQKGRRKKVAIPARWFAGHGDEVVGELQAQGLAVSYKHRRAIVDYLAMAESGHHVSSTQSTGWYDEKTFVLPTYVIGESEVWYQGASLSENPYRRSGSFKQWRSLIAARAVNNPNLVVALCTPLAGVLLRKFNIPGCGLHWFGPTTIGKTTLLECGQSPWGGPAYRRSWSSTANGLEAAALLHTDTVLIVDEIHNVDPRELDAAIYALVNGYGKGRANQLGYARNVSRWRNMVLSSGEVSTETQLSQVGFNVRAGQALRFLDIPTVGVYGAFDDLHELARGDNFADALREAAARHYGWAGPLFVRRLLKSKEDLPRGLSAFLSKFPGENDMQRRVARMFAIIALAGELASSWKIFPWQKETALDAAQQLFTHWKSHAHKSAAASPSVKILAAVRTFLDLHGDSRFSDLHEDVVVRDRAGYWQDVAIVGSQKDKKRIYLFSSTGLHEATRGYDFNLVLSALDEAGAFIEKGPGRHAKVTRTPRGLERLYHIDPEKTQ